MESISVAVATNGWFHYHPVNGSSTVQCLYS